MTVAPDVMHTTRAPQSMNREERVERARKAVATFRRMQPTLSAFARVLTGRSDVSVQMDNGSPRTDGKTIYFRPPIELGMDFKHDRSLCEKRGDDKILLCAACAARESVLVTIYHEISHIAFDSFTPPTEVQKMEIVQRAIRQTGGRHGEAIAARVATAPYYVTESYRGLASLVSEYLPVMVNALEDVRVNREMFRARPGTKIMFEAWSTDAFANGVEQGNGEIIQWRDYPLNAQAMVGLFAKGAGYDFSSWFQPPVVDALNDAEITRLVNQLDTVESTSGVYELAWPILARLKQLGFCLDPEDPQPQPEPEESDETESSDDVQPGPEEGEGEADPDDGGSGAPDSEDSEVDDGDGVPSDDDESRTDGTDASADNEEEVEGDVSGGDEGAEGDPSDDSDGADGDDDDASEPSAGDSDGADAEPVDDDGSSEVEPSDEGGDADADGEGPEDGESEGDGEEELGDEAGANGSDDGGDREDSGSERDGDPSPGTGEPGDSTPGAPQPDAGDTEGVEDEGDEGDVDQAAPGSTPDADVPAGSGADSAADVPEAEGNPDGSLTDPAGDTGEPTEDGTRDDDPRDGAPDEGGIDAPEGDEGTEIDTGADEGQGGVEVDDLPEAGSAADAKQALKIFGNHEEVVVTHEELLDEVAVNVAIVQGLYFETPSLNVAGVVIRRVDDTDPGEGWTHSRLGAYGINKIQAGIDSEIDVPESILGPCLMRMRIAFADNARANQAHNLRSGRVRGRVLGRRAWNDDDRLFQKKTVPGKKDYFVVIGIDISGSTTGKNIMLAKRAAMAQAELLHRAGIKFAMYAHSTVDGSRNELSLEMYEIKGAEEVWTDKQRNALRTIGPVSENLDGHTIEFYRKRCDESTATHKIVLYYTDGKMPASNHNEELEILQREIATCKRAGYTLLGVGIRTNSPIRHGLDTVQVNDDDDLLKVVRHLEKRMT